MSKLKLFASLLLLLPSMALATVTHVTLWEPLPGKSAQMMATAAKAVKINKKQKAYIAQHTVLNKTIIFFKMLYFLENT